MRIGRGSRLRDGERKFLMLCLSEISLSKRSLIISSDMPISAAIF
jgi:hypothetical protein